MWLANVHGVQPTLCVMYFLNYVDRNAIAQARLNNLEEDLGMSGVEFNTCVSILFVGYVLMQIPSSEYFLHCPRLIGS
jgi:hypothetical protein